MPTADRILSKAWIAARRSCPSRTLGAVAVVVLAISSPVAWPASAQTADDPSPSAGTLAATKVALVAKTARIDQIHRSSRRLTLKDALGNRIEVKAAPDVDLDRLHSGDQVSATYYEEVAVGIRKRGEGAPKVPATAVLRDGVTARQATVTARILAIDRNKNTIEIRGTDGKKHTLKVDNPDLRAQLARIRTGDKMDITYTQAVAVSIEPKKK